MAKSNSLIIRKKAAEKYKTLTFTDDYIFCRIMVSRPDLCKQMLEIILGKKIREIKYIDGQDTLKFLIDGKGIRMDVYLEDEENTVYDIEMQTSAKKDISKRTRYYHSVIDINCLEKGKSYDQLNDSFVIFICIYNPFEKYGYNGYKYTFENQCQEYPDLYLDDGCVTIFLNTKGAVPEDQPDMSAFLKFLETGVPTNEFTNSLGNEVITARENETWKEDYIMMCLRDNELIDQGYELGISQGEIKRTCKYYSSGSISLNEAMEDTGLSEELLKDKTLSFGYTLPS